MVLHPGHQGKSRFGTRLALLVVFLVALSGLNPATVGADPITPTAPPARCCAGVAYDAATHTTLVFGGATMTGNLSDTQSWDGQTWTQLSPPTSPGILYNVGMTYDAATQTVLLFGGQDENSGFTNATWSWDGQTWTQLNPTTTPSPRANPLMVYDAATQTVVLFGGTNGQALGETWIWDGSTWTQKLSPAPAAADNASMAYDPAHQNVVLFGGCCGASQTSVWDGSSCVQQATTTNPTVGGAMAADSLHGTVVLFQEDGSTYTWDGHDWTVQSPVNAPSARSRPGLVYDETAQQVLLFGGSDLGFPQNDLWAWDGQDWTAVGLQAEAAVRSRQAGPATSHEELVDMLRAAGQFVR